MALLGQVKQLQRYRLISHTRVGVSDSFQIVQKFQRCMNIPLEKQWECLFSCMRSKPVSLHRSRNNQQVNTRICDINRKRREDAGCGTPSLLVCVRWLPDFILHWLIYNKTANRHSPPTSQTEHHKSKKKRRNERVKQRMKRTKLILSRAHL